VAASLVFHADRTRCRVGAGDHRVDQRALADARCPGQHASPARQPLAKRRQAFSRDGRAGEDLHVQRAEARHDPRGGRLEVGLVDRQDGLELAALGDDEEPLDEARAEPRLARGGDDQQHVHVGGDDLLERLGLVRVDSPVGDGSRACQGGLSRPAGEDHAIGAVLVDLGLPIDELVDGDGDGDDVTDGQGRGVRRGAEGLGDGVEAFLALDAHRRAAAEDGHHQAFLLRKVLEVFFGRRQPARRQLDGPAGVLSAPLVLVAHLLAGLVPDVPILDAPLGFSLSLALRHDSASGARGLLDDVRRDEDGRQEHDDREVLAEAPGVEPVAQRRADLDADRAANQQRHDDP
jgi:hypothetical protein